MGLGMEYEGLEVLFFSEVPPLPIIEPITRIAPIEKLTRIGEVGAKLSESSVKIAGAAVLVAATLAPELLGYCVFAHRSDEAGHQLMLQHLGVQALLDLGLRLGEASGAVLAWPLIASAVKVLNEMASFESAGVSNRELP